MAIVKEEILKKNLSRENLSPVYILIGQDNFLKKNYSEKILKRITDKDDILNCAFFENDCDLQDVYDFVMQMPMMADMKYAEILDYDFENCSKQDFERLCTLISQVPDTAVLVLRFEGAEISSRKTTEKFKTLVSSAEKNGGLAVELDFRSTAELAKMLCDSAKKRGCKMDSPTAYYLIEVVGNDILNLKNEMDKLSAYSNKKPITKETVDKVCAKSVEASVYSISKYLFSQNIEGALKILDELFFMRTEPMIILYTIASLYIDMYRVYASKEQNEPIQNLVQTFKYKNKAFLLDKAAINLKKFDENRLKLSLNELIEADNKLKSFGAEPRIVLEQLIIKLIYIISKGEPIV